MTICVTGHRPNKLWGYDLSDPRWVALKDLFKAKLIANKCDKGVSGMALGVGDVYALAILELKEQGYPIKLHCAIPCRNHSCKWPKASVDLYNSILARADEVVLVSDEYYKPYLMQKRNEYMVNMSDKVIAVWDGTSGGTASCVHYAEQVGKPIDRINPWEMVA